ncbi:MAG: ABC transporter ATP-binding protein [Anaerolineales bacterium]|nr:ABC transporter ATP-binding protein [Anaerolineales bacterium]
MLELDQVSKIYRVGTFGSKELHAVSDVSFSVCKGKVVALIGESGSGKSTIGRMILRLINISSGQIKFLGEDIVDYKGPALKEYYRQVQGVFQDPFCSYNPIFKADRVFQNVRHAFFPDVSDKIWTDKIDQALTAVGLNPVHVLGKYPHQLSGGQLQRFLIARALLLDIQFLVADEIISMLDASTRIDVLNLLADLKESGLAILFITHDLSLANYISEQALILYRGCIAEIGQTESIFETPLHPYTRMLMASVPRLDSKWSAGSVELKSKQLPLNQGCVYYGRCESAMPMCARERPPLYRVAEDHHVACFLYKDR